MTTLADLRRFWRTTLWSRRLPPAMHIRLRVGWPLLLLPLLIFSQIVTPHGVWVVLLVVLIALYLSACLWVRSQVQSVSFERRRQGSVLVAGDLLREEFALRNHSRLPVLWAEFVDSSDLPGYQPGSVVAAPVGGDYRWWKEAECSRRGVFRLGPHRLRLGDPFGLFDAEIVYDHAETLLIYPRVVQLPQVALPRGAAGGAAAARRPLLGALPAASVREYSQGDSLRRVHWPTTAHRGHMMVKEWEMEPAGDVWIVLDLHAAAQRGEGATGTLEYGIILAASMAAEMVSGRERRAVGLLAASGAQVVAIPPQPGQAQLWAIMAALAPAQPSPWSLAELLRRNLTVLGRRHTLIVITPVAPGTPAATALPPTALPPTALPPTALPPTEPPPASPPLEAPAMSQGAGSQGAEPQGAGSQGAEPQGAGLQGAGRGPALPAQTAAPSGARPGGDWVAELLQAQRLGLAAGVLLVAQPPDAAAAAEWLRRLAALDIPAQVLRTDLVLRTALTYRRKRKVIRTTPTGGAYTVEVEEEVG